MKKTLNFIKSEDTKEKYKIGLNSFTRKRKMGFEDIAILSLRNSKKSLQIGINEFIKEFKEQKSKYTKSSYTKARAKVSPSLFTALNDELIESYYEDKEGVELYNGFRIFAIDGSTLQLPNIEAISPKIDGEVQKMSNNLRDIYGYISNNLSDYETKARISILEDVENRITHQGIINSYFSSEKDMAFEHIEYLAELKAKSSTSYNDLIIFDRGYPSYALLFLLESKGIDYLIRMPRKRFKETDDFRDGKSQDKIITIELTKEKIFDIKRNNKNLQLTKVIEDRIADNKVTFRAIKVKLPSGETEILITSLVDKKAYKTKIFKAFYFRRWGVEEEYKAIKSLLQVENFTGITQIAIHQDFFATLFMLNMSNIMISAAQEEKIEKYNQKKKRKYQYKVNRSFAIGSIKNEFIYLLITDGDIEAFYEEMLDSISTNLTPIKPDRSFSRDKKCRHKYPICQKSTI